MTKLLIWSARQECHHNTTREPHQPAKNKLAAAGPRPGSLGPEEKLVGRHTPVSLQDSQPSARKRSWYEQHPDVLLQQLIRGCAGVCLERLGLKPGSERARNHDSRPWFGAWAEDSPPRELSTNTTQSPEPDVDLPPDRSGKNLATSGLWVSPRT